MTSFTALSQAQTPADFRAIAAACWDRLNRLPLSCPLRTKAALCQKARDAEALADAMA